MTAAPQRQQRDRRLWTADQFLDFAVTRPDEERWQLVDGIPMMMVPPSFTHQRIGRNLFALLDRALTRHRPDFLVFYETGLRIPGVEDFNPMPDLLVVPADAEFERYAEDFRLVVEIISPSNGAEMIERKLELYRSHPENLYCLSVDQSTPHIALWTRQENWVRTDFHSLYDTLALPAFGFRARLSDVYAGASFAR
jgi:Uma2 family endonuclease